MFLDCEEEQVYSDWSDTSEKSYWVHKKVAWVNERYGWNCGEIIKRYYVNEKRSIFLKIYE